MVLTLESAAESLGGLHKAQIAGPRLGVPDPRRAGHSLKMGISNTFPVVLTLLVWGPHLENSASGGKTRKMELNMQRHRSLAV